jgi:hypothetical protein
LDKDVSLFQVAGEEEASKRKALRFVVKLSECCGILPPSLHITGVTDCGKTPVAGGGHADIFQATYQGRRVALKCLRDFQVNCERQKNHRVRI